MKQQNPNDRFFLLPFYFKKIIYTVIVIGALGLTILKMTGYKLFGIGNIAEPGRTNSIKLVSSIILALAFVCLAWTAEKNENEMVSLQRLKAIRASFIACLLYIITMSFVVLFGGNAAPFVGLEPIIGMLLVYQIAFKFQKQRDEV